LPSPSIPDFVPALVERARATDGQPPFSDQSLVELRRGERELVTIDELAVAIVNRVEAEFVVDPAARGRGIGTTLLESILASAEPGLLIWAHGDHPAARALAASHGLSPVRSLLQLRAPVPAAPPVGSATSDGSATAAGASAFRPGIDDAEWLRVNGRAFAFHPEQGSVSQSDLEALTAEPWFDANDFLLLRDGDALIGYCWLKLEDGIGEFYVVGVDPDRQGEGLGRRLMAAGFARLADRGIRTAALYVDADNVAAVSLYRSLGFTEHAIDIQYAAS
jgi:mycothiol synthase